MAKIVDTIYFYREKEDNWGLGERAETLGWADSRDVVYLGSEVEMKIEISNEKGIETKVLEINGIDVSDKDIHI